MGDGSEAIDAEGEEMAELFLGSCRIGGCSRRMDAAGRIAVSLPTKTSVGNWKGSCIVYGDLQDPANEVGCIADFLFAGGGVGKVVIREVIEVGSAGTMIVFDGSGNPP